MYSILHRQPTVVSPEQPTSTTSMAILYLKYLCSTTALAHAASFGLSAVSSGGSSTASTSIQVSYIGPPTTAGGPRTRCCSVILPSRRRKNRINGVTAHRRPFTTIQNSILTPQVGPVAFPSAPGDSRPFSGSNCQAMAWDRRRG